MDSFFESLDAQQTGRVDLTALSVRLQSLLKNSPQSADAAARALDAAHRRGVIPSVEYRALFAMLQAKGTVLRAPGNPAGTRRRAAGTAVHANTGVDEVPVTTPDTDHRLGDPHTWTHADDDPLFVGRVLGRHYQLERKIGEGGMGMVFLAKDLVEADFSEQPFLAIKVLKPDFREHPDALKALHEEVRKSRALSHENIVSVYTFDRDASVVFMTMEYLEGKPLNKLIDDDFARGMPFEQAWPIIKGAGKALAYAHDRGVVHSDFKPSNVFVTAGGRPKVLDFGIARAMRQSSSKRFDAGSLGALTLAYASCEMLAGESADPRDDIYAFACVVYETLTGRHVFSGRSAEEARAQKLKVEAIGTLSKLQNRALSEALVFDRSARTKTIEALIEGLQPKAKPRRTTMYVSLAVTAALAVAGLSWVTFRHFAGTNEDEAFIASLVKPNAETPDNVDPERVQLLMTQGDDYFKQAQAHFDPGLLSEGVSTAFGAYRAVLRLDPGSREAAEKIVQIIKLYDKQARELADQQQYKRALSLIIDALKIDPNRNSLKALQAQYEEKAKAEVERSAP